MSRLDWLWHHQPFSDCRRNSGCGSGKNWLANPTALISGLASAQPPSDVLDLQKMGVDLRWSPLESAGDSLPLPDSLSRFPQTVRTKSVCKAHSRYSDTGSIGSAEVAI